MRRVAITFYSTVFLASLIAKHAERSGDRYAHHQMGTTVGFSGDGVEQDGYVSQLGSEGFHPPDELRVDNSVIIDADGREVRAPYVKLTRHPEFQTLR